MTNQPFHHDPLCDKKKQAKLPGQRSVAVVIVHWNCHQDLHRCLPALSTQTVAPTRILVVDNASEKPPEIDKEFPQVELVVLPKNIGFAAANNLAIAMADDCHWLATVNPDATVEPRWLESLLLAAESHPEYASFSSRLLSATQTDRIDGTGDEYHISGLAWRSGHGMPADVTGRQPREVFSACAAAALYRRSALLEVSGLDESFFCYFEDVDLGFRLQLAGHRCLYVSQAVAHHVGSATTGGRQSDFAVYYGHRNMVWTYWKNMPWPLLCLYLPHHLLANVVSVLWYSLRGQMSVICRAKRDALLGLWKILRLRRCDSTHRKTEFRRLSSVLTHGWLTPYQNRLRPSVLSFGKPLESPREPITLVEHHEPS